MKTIADQWSAFNALVVPKDAPLLQKQEMQRAFYAGATAMFTLQCCIGDEAVSEDAAMQIMAGWEDEFRQFAQQVSDGSA